MYGHRFINIETEEEDNMADNQFASTIGALFQGMDEFVTTKTVVGEPVTVGDAIILPLVDVTCGMAAGAFGQSAKERECGRHERQDDAERGAGHSEWHDEGGQYQASGLHFDRAFSTWHRISSINLSAEAPDRSMRRRCRQLRKWRRDWEKKK